MSIYLKSKKQKKKKKHKNSVFTFLSRNFQMRNEAYNHEAKGPIYHEVSNECWLYTVSRLNTVFCVPVEWKLSHTMLSSIINNFYYRSSPLFEWNYTRAFLNLKADVDNDLCDRQNCNMAPQIPTPWWACPV